jgi:hypothetical protein
MTPLDALRARLRDRMPVGRKVTFASWRDKAAWLDAQASLDATSRTVLARAFELGAGKLGPEELAQRAHGFVRDRILYVRDPPTGEEFADSVSILRRGFDDCDGKSRLFVALCRAARILGTPLEARIRPVFPKPQEFRHVQAEVRWPGSSRFPRAMPGGWVLAELILRGVNLGQSPATAPRDAAGKWELA